MKERDFNVSDTWVFVPEEKPDCYMRRVGNGSGDGDVSGDGHGGGNGGGYVDGVAYERGDGLRELKVR